MIGNLFGLLPYDPSGIPLLSAVLTIGIWPIIMGVTMWAQQSLNPPPPDKIQQRIFAFLPVMFTVFLAGFAAALVIYWAWNNFLTILQQYIIMRRQGVETELDKNVLRLRSRLTGAPLPARLTEGDPPADATAGEKAAVIEGKALEAVEDGDKAGEVEADAAAKAEADDTAEAGAGEGESADAAPARKPAAKRTSSNPAAKKKRSGGGSRRKPGGKR